MKTHAFALYQGLREHDTNLAIEGGTEKSTPTQHGLHLMKSRHEALWATRFERRGFTQAGILGVTVPPCYFYEPRGMKRWPTYRAGTHYRIDFVLVSEVKTVLLEGIDRSRATRWEWISIKPIEDTIDLDHLKALVAFDSLHQRAFQCAGKPDEHPIITIVTWNGTEAITRRV